VAGNDVNLGLLGEQWLGAARGVKNIIGLFPGTGIGGAIVSQGTLFLGREGAAAELGHMIMDLNGPPCSCGNRGCLEALASRWAIERDIRRAVKRGEKTILTEYTEKLSPIKSKMLRKALGRKDPLVTHIIREAALTLGKACINLKHIFNPEMIVLGGGVIEACGDYMLPVIQKVSQNDPFFKSLKPCKIVESSLEDDAVMLGAVALVKNSVLKVPR
jgi:glucokinase